MNHIISIFVGLCCGFLAYITLNETLCKKIKLFCILSGNMEYEGKALKTNTVIILSIVIAIISYVVSLVNFYAVSDVINITKIEISLICITGAACVDFREHRIPNIFPLALTLSAVILLFLGFLTNQNGAMSYVLSSIFATIAIAIFMLIASFLTKQGIGLGDIKLLCSIALMCGVVTSCGILFFGMIICVVVAVILLLLKKKKLNEGLPFAPFIYIGFILSIIFMNF